MYNKTPARLGTGVFATLNAEAEITSYRPCQLLVCAGSGSVVIFGSGLSATTASVVSNSANWGSVLQCGAGNLGWVDNTWLSHVFPFAGCSVIADALLFFLQLFNNDRAFLAGVFGNLANWFFQCTLNNVDPGLNIAVFFQQQQQAIRLLQAVPPPAT